MPSPSQEQMIKHLLRAHEVAVRAREAGHHPFGCVIVAADNETVLVEHGNIDTVEHAEACAVRSAWRQYSEEILRNCTLYTTVEPCLICAGTFYWSNLARLVYGISETSLRQITGNDCRNPTLDLPCRKVFAAGSKQIEVIGPVAEVSEVITNLHRQFWL
mgnify:CR=1 FL=1